MSPSDVRRVSGVTVLAALLLTACGGSGEKDGLASAQDRLSRNDVAGAVIDLKTTLQKSPKQAEARFLLGVALLRLGDAPGAIVELTKAAESGYDDDKVQPKLAWARLNAGRVVEVIKTTEKIELRDRPSQAELLAALSLAQSAQKQEQTARASVEKALAVDPASAPALSVKARYLAAAGDYAGALALLEKIPAAVASNRGEDQLLRGTILRFGAKDLVGAEKAYVAAAAFPAQTLSARTALIQMYMGDGRTAEAEKQLAELRKTHPKDPMRAYLEAVLAYASKDFTRASGLTEQLLKLAPDNAPLLLLGGAINLQQGKLLSAEARLGKVIHVEKQARSGRLLLADAYIRMGQPEKALGTLQPLTEGGRQDPAALPLAGQANLALGHVDEAERLFVAAAKLRPDDVQLKTTLAMLDLARGHAQDAFVSLDALAQQDKGDVADLALISARLKRKEFDAALQALDRLQKKQPNAPGPWQLRGICLQEKGDIAGARSAFEQALKIDPRHFSSVAALVGLDLGQQQLDGARKRIDAAVLAEPKNVTARMLQLEVMSRQKAPPTELMASIDQAIATMPDDPRPRVAKISHLLSNRDVKGAASAAQDAMAAIPNNPLVLESAGLALGRSGDMQQALAAFGKWASLTPNSPGPHLRIASLQVLKGNTPAAVSALVRGLEQLPDSADIQLNLINLAIRWKEPDPLRAIGRDLKSRLPKLAIGPVLEGLAAASKKDWPAAIASYREGLGRADPSRKNSWLLFDALVASGNLAEAKKFIESWQGKHPEDTAFLLHASGTIALKGDEALAERLLAKVVEVEPRNVRAINNLAWLMSSRKAAGAGSMAKRAVDLAPNDAAVWDTYARALESEGKADAAIDAQRKASGLMPARVPYRIALARLLQAAGKKADAQQVVDALQKEAGARLTPMEKEAIRGLNK